MDKQHFDQLAKGVREMKRHLAGKRVRGTKTTELPPTSAPSAKQFGSARASSRN
jgi:hypothetical protein